MLGGSVSVISLAYVFHCYFVRGWRRHPNRLLIYRSMSDLVSALAVIGFAVAEGGDSGWGARGSACSVLAVVFNPGVLLFSFFASEAWGLVLIHDVVRMIRNPMRNCGMLVISNSPQNEGLTCLAISTTVLS